MLIKAQTAANQSLHALTAHPFLLIRQAAHLSGISLGVWTNAHSLRSVKPLHHHSADPALGLSELLAHAADRAHLINAISVRGVLSQVLLCGKENTPAAAHRSVERRNGGRALHIEGYHHAGEHIKPPQGKHRQPYYFVVSFLGIRHNFSLFVVNMLYYRLCAVLYAFFGDDDPVHRYI